MLKLDEKRKSNLRTGSMESMERSSEDALGEFGLHSLALALWACGAVFCYPGWCFAITM
jgi:hypothetical protein